MTKGQDRRPAYRLGRGVVDEYRMGDVLQFTLVLTEECNLRCGYCYMVGLNNKHIMSSEIGRKTIDCVLDLPITKGGVNLDFIGGEPTLEMELMDELTDYFTDRLRSMPHHPWHSAYIISVGTNGTTYRSNRFQHYLSKNRGHVWVGLTIDGPKSKHDIYRVFKDGRGSFDTVYESAKLWRQQFAGAGPKVTFGHKDIHLVCESILFIWEDLNMDSIAANVVFEDVWEPGDPEIFENQLKTLADIAIEKGYWRTKSTTLFWPALPLERIIENEANWCGTGSMISVDCEGNIYPCVRFLNHSLANRKGRHIGNIHDGLDWDRIRAFKCLCKTIQSTQECLQCTMQQYCAWCTGFNFDTACSDTIFQRATYRCEMHKAQWRANQYYWQQLEQKHGVRPDPATASRQPAGCLV